MYSLQLLLDRVERLLKPFLESNPFIGGSVHKYEHAIHPQFHDHLDLYLWINPKDHQLHKRAIYEEAGQRRIAKLTPMELTNLSVFAGEVERVLSNEWPVCIILSRLDAGRCVFSIVPTV